MTFYTPSDALNYIKGQVHNLFAARKDIQDAYGRAVLAQSLAMRTENFALKAKANQLVQDLTTLLQDQTNLENKVRELVPEAWTGLGIVPLIIGIGAIAIAGAIYLHFQNVQVQKQALADVEAGLLTPAQAAAIVQGGGILGAGGLSGITGNLGTILLYGAIVYGLFLFGPMIARRFQS